MNNCELGEGRCYKSINTNDTTNCIYNKKTKRCSLSHDYKELSGNIKSKIKEIKKIRNLTKHKMYDDCLLQIGNKYRGEDEYHNTIYCNKLNNESDEKCSKSSEFRFDNCNNVI